MGFSRQEYWSGLPCPPPGDRPNPGLEAGSPALQALPSEPPGKEPACQQRKCKTQVQSLGREDTLEKGMATHSSILAWKIPWAEEPMVHRVRVRPN